ncbi:flagellar assembly protein FliH [Glaciecola sp. MH2013]|uniref:flagellar assembly protein FliH n=1 Tax=Glaciecola sp. MH2013 TaxID=2785524 RepID=UPI00189D3818|nr:flagellar assembly protein FliH [Glaciecola sp. MH2013]MBF7072372.1 flagellar assembly protein FliH [Glaciecola sp. MH2013]
MSIASTQKGKQSYREFDSTSATEAQAWDYPTVDEELKASQQDSVTNALNRPRQWKYEPPEIEEEVKPLTAEDIETIRQSAFEEGYAAGKEEGFQAGFNEGKDEGLAKGLEEGKNQGLTEGMEAGQQQIESLANSWATLIEQSQHPLRQVNSELEKELVILASELAKAVIGLEVSTQKEVLLNAISEGIKVLPIQESTYQFQMHPLDVAMVKGHFSEQKIAENNWQLIENQSIEQGGCEIITENNAVDMSISKRTKDVFAQFLSAQGVDHDPRNS